MNLDNLRLYLHPEGDDGGGDASGGGFEGDSGDAGGDSVQSDPVSDPITFEAGAQFQGPGMDKPITWGENGPEGYIPQSEYTRTRQRETAQLQQLQQQLQAAQGRERQYQQWQAQVQAQARGQQQPQQDPRHAALEAAKARGGWVHVNDVEQIMSHSDQQVAELRSMIEQTAGTQRHLVAGQQNVAQGQQAIQRHRAQQELDGLSDEIIKANPVLSGGDRAEANRFLSEIYDSYQMQPGETRETFMAGLRELATQRIAGMVNMVQKHQKSARDVQRRARIPGPSSNPPLTGEGKPITDSAHLADKLWERFGGGGPQ